MLEWLSGIQPGWPHVDLSWLTVAVFLSAVALFIAFQNFWRGNYVYVKILGAQHGSDGEVEIIKGEDGAYRADVVSNTYIVSVTIQNLGVPLSDIQMTLNYHHDGGGFGRAVVFRTDHGKIERPGAFVKGAITTLYLRTDAMDGRETELLRSLEDKPPTAGRTLCLYSEGYPVFVYELDRRSERFRYRVSNRVRAIRARLRLRTPFVPEFFPINGTFQSASDPTPPSVVIRALEIRHRRGEYDFFVKQSETPQAGEPDASR